jgi:hypothetical protein
MSREGFAVHMGEPLGRPLKAAICTLAGLPFPVVLRSSVRLIVSRLLRCMRIIISRTIAAGVLPPRVWALLSPFSMSPIATNILACR